MQQNSSKQVLMALRRIIRAVDLNSRDLVKKFGVTGPQLVVMKTIHENKEMTIGKIAMAAHLSSATVTDIIDRLEKRGMVHRVRSTVDKRRVFVSVTNQGQHIISNTPPLLQEQLSEKFAQLEDWEQNLILSSLQRIVSMLEVQKLDAASMLATGPLTADSDLTQEFLEEPKNSPDSHNDQRSEKF